MTAASIVVPAAKASSILSNGGKKILIDTSKTSNILHSSIVVILSGHIVTV
jgi:hypothetical protein